MDAGQLFSRLLPAITAVVFWSIAGVFFTVKYGSAEVLPLFFDADEKTNRVLFFLNFYVPSGICLFTLFGILFGKGFLFKCLCLAAGFASAVISCYVLDDLFSITLYGYSSFVLTAAAGIAPPKNVIIAMLSILLFIFFLFHPSFMGLAQPGLSFTAYPSMQVLLLAVYLAFLTAAMAVIRYLAEKQAETNAEAEHLNQVGKQMLLFNHRLQEYVKKYGEDAIKEDRLRFTSELHDSCGYVFTNIIAITDAAISFSSMETQKMHDTFQLIQNQAREGLQKTRETLHMIRGIQDPGSGSLESIFEMKKIFEEVTGIQVELETGNIKLDYGPSVNRSLVRIIQEAFTNSVRHGKATRIVIRFWEFPGSLEMLLRDNGMGSRHIVKGIGLAGMEERMQTLGGTIEVSSPADGGFALKVTIPLLMEGRNGEFKAHHTAGG
jgi:signal transduction histidine kinase